MTTAYIRLGRAKKLKQYHQNPWILDSKTLTMTTVVAEAKRMFCKRIPLTDVQKEASRSSVNHKAYLPCSSIKQQLRAELATDMRLRLRMATCHEAPLCWASHNLKSVSIPRQIVVKLQHPRPYLQCRHTRQLRLYRRNRKSVAHLDLVYRPLLLSWKQAVNIARLAMSISSLVDMEKL